MPIYEYLCKSCGHRFDARQSFHDEPLTDCTECGAPVRRVLHPAGVIFKGSGWYINDSRKSQSDSKASSGDHGNAASDGGTSDKSEKSKDTSKDTSTGEPKSTAATPVSSKKEPAAAAAND
jgi:putative FmdB family regulatory protein